MPRVVTASRARLRSRASPSLQGFERIARLRSRASRTGKPPVARTSGSSGRVSGSGPRPRPVWTSPTARTSASVRPRGSKRRPTVRGFFVSAATSGAPSDSSQSSESSSRSTISRWSRGSPFGHSRRKSASEGYRQMTPLDSSIEPPGRSPFSSTVAATPSSRARAAAHRPAMPAPATTIS